jgi:molecular chaperone DnaK
MSSTIDFGIDLGTTNSSIAALRGTEVEVFRNNEGFEYTPSAVWLDKNGGLRVGRRAKERLEDDRENAFCEFKLQMGTGIDYVFARNGAKLKPEELSAEVLKSLKADVAQKKGEEVLAAVITTPAAFEQPQVEATQRAAQLAGFLCSPLLQEPIAAAMAYGFQSESDKVFWLVYDLGGGTFDAAVIHVRDGVIQVVNHGGDNHLGGKLLDWEIVEQLLIPALVREHRVTDFRRGNPKWIAAVSKLKLQAEQAKIRLSRDESVDIGVDYLCADDSGTPVRFEYELRRADVERLAEPYIVRSINICKRVLAERRLGVSDIERILLVGGPTLMPYLRQRLADPRDGLGIPLEFSIDPLTVVARGAAIFSGTQRFQRPRGPVVEGTCRLALEYQPVGADPEPLVGGVVQRAEGTPAAGCAIEFVNDESRPPWRSPRLQLPANGSFMTNLFAERGRRNTFRISLFDATGSPLLVQPDSLSYTIGMSITDPPLMHSVGVALANNEMEWLIEKGTPLPARRRCRLRTATEVKAGQPGHVLHIPVMEGQNPRADRNQQIGMLAIDAATVKRSIPVGSEVEVTIEIDGSRLMKAKAYLPILDEEFEKVISYEDYRKKAKDAGQLREEVDRQRKRLEEARQSVEQTADAGARAALDQIEREQMLQEVESSLGAAAADRDAADKCQSRLLDLKAGVDRVEEALEWPRLVAQATKEIEEERNIVNNAVFEATEDEKRAFRTLEKEIHEAMEHRDPDLLRRKVQEMDRLGVIIVVRQPGWWAGRFRHLRDKRGMMTDPGQADAAFRRGQQAIDSNDVEGLKSAVRELVGLLPAGDEDRDKVLSSLMR